MKRVLAALVATAAMATPAITAPTPADPTAEAIGFLCSAEGRAEAKGERTIVMQPHMGSGGFPVAASPQAQAWFDYGLKLGHAFYHEDAKAAFAKAAEIDPICAMCVWGQAYAAGSTLNYDVSKKDDAAAKALAIKAKGLARTEPEKALTAAMVTRYAGRKGSELAFAKAMETLAARYPQNLDLAVISAHSYLLVARRGDDAQTAKSVAMLEKVLKTSPEHTGAIHFYIHATEFAGESQKALPYANKLAGLAPDASHLVHMAAHTFFRAGRYQDASLVNAKAIGVDTGYETRMNGKGKLRDIPYYGHNLGFGLGGALMSGDGDLALRFARHVGVAYPAAELGDRSLWQEGPAMIAYGRFDPAAALALADPGKDKPGLRMMRHYARGEAYALKGDIGGLRGELLQMRADTRRSGSLGAKAQIARLVLEGRLAMLRDRPAEAIAPFKAAVKLQDRQYAGSMDPPPWWFPVRRSLAAAQVMAGEPAAAVETATVSLKEWPNDALTLAALAEAQRKLGQAGPAAQSLAQARKAWQGDLDDVPFEAI